MKQAFDKEILLELLDCSVGETFESHKVLAFEKTYQSRWAQHKRIIFEFGEKIWASDYSIGLTEQQDQSPYEYDAAEAYEVAPHEKIIIEYKTVV